MKVESKTKPPAYWQKEEVRADGAGKGRKKMGMTVKTFSDGTSLEFGRGKLDEWCVFHKSPNGRKTAPRDEEYFGDLKRFAVKYGTDKVYGDFVRTYDLVDGCVNETDLKTIDAISATYGIDAERANKLLTILYMAMIAEENKRNARLGKRIKRLGTHVLLKENADPIVAANFMRGIRWQKLDEMCRARGF